MEFNPDWELNAIGKLSVALTVALSRHIPEWPGATDEQIEAVAIDIAKAGRWTPAQSAAVVAAAKVKRR
jgi:hypothetical protein